MTGAVLQRDDRRETATFTASADALIELLFFAYRDFVSDPDRILTDYGFGRAHHRVLHFVHLHPGLTIAELLDILRITKQSLNRVLKELIHTGFIEARAGKADRRQRLLFATAAGIALSGKLSALQRARISEALAELPRNTDDVACRFLLAMIDNDDRDHVAKLVYGRSGASDDTDGARRIGG